jgi:hypothetical protein
MARRTTNVVRIIDAIDKPLGFFVLSLLIVETFLGIVLVGANFDQNLKYNGMLIGVGIFLLLIVLVTFMTIFCPHKLVYDKDAHATERGKSVYGTNEKQLDRLDNETPTVPK